MKTIFTAAIMVILSSVIMSGQQVNPNYDSTLAKTLGADKYGMKMYVMVILKTGSNNVQDKATRDSLFAGHQKNIRKLAGMKKLIVAGPFSENDRSYRGIFILDVRSFEEAKTLLSADPTIKEKIFEPEFFHWYGSAALPEYMPVYDKIWKINP
jgi:uncharacterized protein YciI